MASSESASQGFAIEALEAVGWLEARVRPGLARGPRKCFLSFGPSLVLFVWAEYSDHLVFSRVQSNKLMDEERDACATVTMTIAPGGSQETRAATDFCLRRACASLRVCSAERQSAMVRSSATRVDSVETRERAEELSAAVQWQKYY